MFKPLISCLALVALSMQMAGAQQIYLSPSGNDANSGTQASPVYSLAAARDLIRKMPAGSDTVTVWIAPGEYRMERTVVFDQRDTRPVVFRSQGDRKPVFVGGVSVSGWTPWQNGIWRTQLSETLHFEQLYVNGSRAVRARTPNTGWYYVKGSKDTVFDK